MKPNIVAFAHLPICLARSGMSNVTHRRFTCDDDMITGLRRKCYADVMCNDHFVKGLRRECYVYVVRDDYIVTGLCHKYYVYFI